MSPLPPTHPDDADPPADRSGALPSAVGGYRIVREIGRGGMGVVYEAEDAGLGRRVALKVLAQRLQASERAFARFEREVRAVARLQHPNIVPVFEVGEAEGCPYFTMELVSGETLHRRLERVRSTGTAPSQWSATQLVEAPSGAGFDAAWPTSYVGAVCRLALQVARGLQHAHAHGVVHRDVKPSNVMVADDGRALLFDFGLAKVDAELGLTHTGEFVGTPHYVSPEQARHGIATVDERSDVYALGATLYEMLTAAVPYSGDTPHEILRQVANGEPRSPRRVNRAVPRDLETVCMTAMEADPARRYQTAQAFAEDLERFLGFRTVRARAAGPLMRAARWVRRNALLTGLSVALALFALASLLAAWQFGVNRAVERERRVAQEASALAWFRSAQLLAQRGDWRQALVDYRRAAQTGHADRVGVTVGIIEALEGCGQLRAARTELDALWGVGDLGDREAEVLLLRGDLGVNRHDNPEAGLAAVRQALLHGGLSAAQSAYARALLASDLVATRTLLEQALALQPYHRRAHECLAPVLVSMGELRDAQQAAARMAAMYPGDPYPLLMQVAALGLQRDFVRASRLLERARALLPGSGGAALDRWAADLAVAAGVEDTLLTRAAVGGFPELEASELVWQLLVSPTRVLPGVGGGGGVEAIAVRLPPALARSYRPLAALLSFVAPAEGAPVGPEDLQRIEEILTDSLEIQPDGFRQFLRGLYRFALAAVRAGPEREAALADAGADFAASVELPSMLSVSRAAPLYLMSARLLRWEGAAARTNQRERYRSEALAAMKQVVQQNELRESVLLWTAQAALRLEALDLAHEVGLRWQRRGPEPLADLVVAEVELRRGHKTRAVRLLDRVLARRPDLSRARELRAAAAQ